MSFADWSAPFGAALSVLGSNMAQFGLAEHARKQTAIEDQHTRSEDIKLWAASQGKVYDENRRVLIDSKTGEAIPLDASQMGQMGQMGKPKTEKKSSSTQAGGGLDFSNFINLGYTPKLDPIPGVLNNGGK